MKKLVLGLMLSGGVGAEPPLAPIVRSVQEGLSAIQEVSASPTCPKNPSAEPLDGPSCASLSVLGGQLQALYSERRRGRLNALGEADLNRLSQAQEDGATRCLAERFQLCYPKLRLDLPLDELKILFAGFTQNPRLRQPIASGECAYRAEQLARELAERGVSAQVVRIQYAPTLIAMERRKAGELTGGYYDYHGYHTLVQVMVGKKREPYLLDPQFMQGPLPRDEYFRRTMGQTCQLSTAEAETAPLSYLDCAYRLMSQNEPADSFNYAQIIKRHGATACGWRGDITAVNAPSGEFAVPGELRLLNPNGPEEKAPAGWKLEEGVQKKLILRAYENLGLKLETLRQEWAARVEDFEKQPPSPFLDFESLRQQELLSSKVQLARIMRDIPLVETKLKEVRRNLKP